MKLEIKATTRDEMLSIREAVKGQIERDGVESVLPTLIEILFYTNHLSPKNILDLLPRYKIVPEGHTPTGGAL